ncbi:MAG: iron ABC transporter [Rhodothermaceae bacterium]|nr:MAG: iron ABC transporter [Rhodothermaceae bacterium]
MASLSITDARGRRLRLENPPRRIVSLVPSQTELLADLGLGPTVVGVTRFCIHPDGWKREKTIVGGTKNVNLDRVRALRPDLILANLEENTRADIEALDALAPVFVTDVRDLDGALDMIRTVGRLTGTVRRAAELADGIAAGFAALPPFPACRAAYLIWRDPYMSVGADTFIHDMLYRAGFVNVFGHRTRYPVVTPDDLRAARPDVILLSSEPYPFRATHREELRAQLPGPAIHLVDGEPFSWYGSRLRYTPAYLMRLRARITAGPAQTSA